MSSFQWLAEKKTSFEFDDSKKTHIPPRVGGEYYCRQSLGFENNNKENMTQIESISEKLKMTFEF